MMRVRIEAKYSTIRMLRSVLCICSVAAISLSVQADPPYVPLPAPAYSFDLSSPSVESGIVGAGEVLQLDFPYPRTLLSGEMLGLWSALDDLDGLSSSNSEMTRNEVFALLFSVDRDTIGLAAPDPNLINAGVPYNALDQALRRHAAGDRFYSTEYFTRERAIDAAKEGVRKNNYLCRNNFDEGGTDFSAYPETHANTILTAGTRLDLVDATAKLQPAGSGGLPPRVYFSLTGQSPSLATLPGWENPSGASIFFVDEPGSDAGACCLGGWDCEYLSENDCDMLDGQWMGAGSECSVCSTLSTPGACCLPSGDCILGTEFECWAHWGIWYGPGSTCELCDEPNVPPGACVLWNSVCIIIDAQTCGKMFGSWHGPETSCEDINAGLDQVGACCFADGRCEKLDEAACMYSRGAWLGAGVSCSACPATPYDEGACCFRAEECAVIDEYRCLAWGGEWAGADSTCDMCEVRLGGSRLSLYASFIDLGLTEADDIDALIVFDENENGKFDGGDQVLFSLSSSSPSLNTIPGASASGAAADIFTVSPGVGAQLFSPARDLGLGAASDNIDSLEYHLREQTSHIMAPHGIRAPKPEESKPDPNPSQNVAPRRKPLSPSPYKSSIKP